MQMRKILIPGILLLVMLASCKEVTTTPRPTIPMVYSILADSTGQAHLVSMAGDRGAEGSIAIIGEPSDVIVLARRFQSNDAVDNIDGRPSRDSLPDFAGERFDVILDALFAPYGETSLDSLREAAVTNALFAWDSTCFRSTTDSRPLLRKQRSKLLIYTSALQAAYGLFDVDTLQQLTGGKSRLLSPALLMMQKALDGGARNLAVWTDSATAASHAWEAVFDEVKVPGATLEVLVPEDALDIRTQYRDVLSQYRTSERSLDALLLDSYTPGNLPLLVGETGILRSADTDEEMAFDKLLSPSFCILEPVSIVVDATYRLLREQHLFTHRIARPSLSFYESDLSTAGEPILLEASEAYIQRTYVSNLD